MTPYIVRSALFVPSTRTERIPKAIASGADVVIVDLEDAVEEALKEQAREHLHTFLSIHTDIRVLVRVNAFTHHSHQADVALCQQHAGVIGIMLPKAETVDHFQVARATGKPLWPIIESAQGLVALPEMARVAGVERLSFGSLDLTLDMSLGSGSRMAEQMLNYARYTVLLHSRAAKLAAPLDGVFPVISDAEGLRRQVAFARDMGFGGSLCIHPTQVDIIHKTLMPDPAELDWARRVVALADSDATGVFTLDGQMVDAPVILRARSLLRHAEG